MIKRVVSGGQTGADRAALDVAIKAKTDMPKCKKPRRMACKELLEGLKPVGN